MILLNKTNVRLMMAVVLSLMFTFILWSLVYVEVPEANADVLKVTLGFLGGAFVTMVTFYFGDSEGK